MNTLLLLQYIIFKHL